MYVHLDHGGESFKSNAKNKLKIELAVLPNAAAYPKRASLLFIKSTGLEMKLNDDCCICYQSTFIECISGHLKCFFTKIRGRQFAVENGCPVFEPLSSVLLWRPLSEFI